ncbi:MAG: FAD-linked oxidase [Microbacterium sp.]|nr:FAD-linked oxidase [Microbacterium sp.]
MATDSERAARVLRTRLGERVSLPGDPGYLAGAGAWNLAFPQRPFAVMGATGEGDIVDAVLAARDAGLRVAPQSTGHAAGALADSDLSDVVMLSLERMREVSVDPGTRVATVAGGSTWGEVVTAAATHGLAALHGSAADVSVVGLALSGGLSFYARESGLTVNSVRSVRVVCADGEVRTASDQENPDLFWALRGGAGGFGVVVSLELELIAVAEVYAGMLLWPVERADAVAEAWAAVTGRAPESATTSLRIMHFPPIPDLPPFLSGRSLVVVDGVIHDDPRIAEALIAPLRRLDPEIDTFALSPVADVLDMHLDPPEPTPVVTAHRMLRAFPEDAVARFVRTGVADSLFILEVRHVGGRAARPTPGGGAVSALSGEYLVLAIAVAPDPTIRSDVETVVHGAVDGFHPWVEDALALTFVDGGADPAAGFGGSLAALREAKRRWDADGILLAAHPV